MRRPPTYMLPRDGTSIMFSILATRLDLFSCVNSYVVGETGEAAAPAALEVLSVGLGGRSRAPRSRVR